MDEFCPSGCPPGTPQGYRALTGEARGVRFVARGRICSNCGSGTAVLDVQGREALMLRVAFGEQFADRIYIDGERVWERRV